MWNLFRRKKVKEGAPIAVSTNIAEYILGLSRSIDVQMELPYTTKSRPKAEAIEALVHTFGCDVVDLLLTYRGLPEAGVRERLGRCAYMFDAIQQYLVSLGYVLTTSEEIEQMEDISHGY